MSMQIKKIVLYNPSGEKQEIPFKLGTVNIITGKTGTGKSALIPIIEYCLGQSQFNVPGKVIRNAVSWYAVLYQIGDSQVFIAKRAPVGSTYQSQVCYKEGVDVEIPELGELKPESDDYKVKERLFYLLSPPKDSNARDERRLHDHVHTTLANAIFYLFQDQDTITHSRLLFRRQQDAAKKIRETLPYFLRVVDEAYSKLQKQLDDAKNELTSAKRRIREKQRVIEKTVNDGQNLITEARRVGLIETDEIPGCQDKIISMLKKVVRQDPEPKMLIFPSVKGDERLSQLDRDIEQLDQRHREIVDEISRIEVHAKDTEQYTDAVHEHLARLESIHLFDKQLNFLEDEREVSKWCPLCSSELPTPTAKISAINNKLLDLQRNLTLTERKKPRLNLAIQELKQQQKRIVRQIRQKEAIVEKIWKERKQKKALEQRIIDDHNETNRVINRIEYYLETLDEPGDTTLLQRQVEDTTRQIKEYKDRLLGYSFKRNLDFILHELNTLMTDWAKRLELQGSNINSYQFDINELTIITKDGQDIIPMNQIGGHDNYLGCHLILLLALHTYFVKKQRPVPHFLILDQPAQGYFPEQKDYEQIVQQGANSDLAAVRRMFNFLFDVCETLAPNFQLIILEHANLEDEPRFQNALVEGCPWTGSGKHALIPEGWIAEESQKPQTVQLNF